MSQHLDAKYAARYRKRKRETKEKEVPSKPALTNAERMRQYRLRKKLANAATNSSNDVNADIAESVDPEPVAQPIPGECFLEEATGINTEPVVVGVMPEPMPGRSIDPVAFENVLQSTPSFCGKYLQNKEQNAQPVSNTRHKMTNNLSLLYFNRYTSDLR